MSTVRANTYLDASGGSNAQLFGVASPPNSMGFRNRIINGDMRIDQRNAGASISFASGDGNYCLDRWRLQRSGSATGTVQQSTIAPTGFINSLLVTVSSGASPAAGDFYTVGQVIEGFNCSDLLWGTANAVSITIGFWVRSSVTGTYSASVFNPNVGGNTYPATFTINTANTFEYKTITIPGATAGTWATNNLGSIYLRVDLGSGSNYSTATANAWNTSGLFRTNSSVNFMATTGATFYITGVQLEAGSVATPFERRDYGRELHMCQRYYQTIMNIWSNAISGCVGTMNANDVVTNIKFSQQMRATPTITTFSENGTAGRVSVNRSSAGFAANQLGADSWGVTLLNGSGSPFTSVSNVTFGWTASAEL